MKYFNKIVFVLAIVFSTNLGCCAQVLDKVPIDDYYKVVAQDGTGNFTTIQEAINASKSFPYKRITIFIKNGTYHEKVKIHEWNTNISLIGESKETTIITFDDYFSKIKLGVNSTFYTYTMLIEGDGFSAQNLTIQNASGEVGQAIALSVHANQVGILNCKILGNQDSLYLSGKNFKNYFKDCYIEGTTDFIFGNATAFFENCTLHSLKDSYITAAATPQDVDYGFVFKNCKLTASANVNAVFLGRPWRFYAKTVFIECEMGKQIKPQGWDNWSKPEAEKNTFYAEYNCSGEGYLPKERVSWSHQLNRNQAKKYSAENVLGTDFIKFLSLEKLGF